MVKKARLTNEPLDRKVELFGLRTADDAFEVGFDGLTIANNVDARRSNKIARRPGYADTSYAPGGTIHSAWADDRLFLFQLDTSLMRFNGIADVTTVATGLTAGGKLSAYRFQNNHVHWSNGTETGVVLPDGTARSLGITPPDREDAAATIDTGDLAAGRYLYTFTFVESDGRESGAPYAKLVTVPENSGLSFTFSAGLARNFYISEVDGEDLYLGATVAAGETSLVYRAGQPYTSIQLDRLETAPPTPWTDVDWFRASAISAVEDRVEWTLPFQYELRDFASGYMMFGEAVYVVAGLQDGFYVGTENAHYWLTGPDMSDLELTQVLDYGAIPGTKVHINGGVVGTGESKQRIPMWATQRGIVVGLPGGGIRTPHENVVDFPGGSTGTALYRKASRQNHYIARVLT